MSGLTNGIIPRRRFSSPLFNGASFELKDPQDIRAIAGHPLVSNIWPITRISLPSPLAEGAVNINDLLSRRRKRSSRDSYPPHVVTGVDRLHADGYDGSGVVIAIIDSGVDFK